MNHQHLWMKIKSKKYMTLERNLNLYNQRVWSRIVLITLIITNFKGIMMISNQINLLRKSKTKIKTLAVNKAFPQSTLKQN